MRILLAPDSFKGSLTAKEIAQIIAHTLQSKLPKAHITQLPFSDGGEGALDFLEQISKGTLVWCTAQNALGKSIEAPYFQMEKTAWIELSQTAGLTGISPDEQNPLNTTTYGVGLQIRHALEAGLQTIYLGIGGSATNDLGLGIFCALGGQLLDVDGQLVPPNGKGLQRIHRIDSQLLIPEVHHMKLTVVCDVNNPLVGELGAATVFAPQKGADKTMVNQLEKGGQHVGEILETHASEPILHFPGSGAAGGTAAGMRALFNAQITSGFETISHWAKLEERLETTDLLITGEGCLDAQSIHGKVPLSLAQKAQQYQVPVLAICGQIKLSNTQLQAAGVAYAHSLVEDAGTLTKAMNNPKYWLKKATATALNHYLTSKK